MNSQPKPFNSIKQIAHKPDNIKSHNSLKLSFINISHLPSSFVGCESFLEPISLQGVIFL